MWIIYKYLSEAIYNTRIRRISNIYFLYKIWIDLYGISKKEIVLSTLNKLESYLLYFKNFPKV